jgi:transcriptional regulator with XRE-family HTH domain
MDFDGQRRAELARFLRSKRSTTRIADSRTSNPRSRRVSGLRREEVAELANISSDWYTRLEQGRDIQVSVQVVEDLALALRLSAAERVYFATLALPGPQDRELASSASVVPETLQLIKAMETITGILMNDRWDVLAWNEAAAAAFGDYSSLSFEDRNVLWLVFQCPAYKNLIVDWKIQAQEILASFRLDYARMAPSAEFDRLITRLITASSEFRSWWNHNNVAFCSTNRKRFTHPTAGLLVMNRIALTLSASPRQTLVTYTPDDNSKSKIRHLLTTKGMEEAGAAYYLDRHW